MDLANQTCPSASSSSFLQLVMTQLVTPLIGLNCDLTSSYPNDQTSRVYQQPHPEYDFIVVGAGSAGCAIANRLSEISSWKILVIEAGSDPPVNSDIPSLYPTLMQSPYDWSYSTAPSNNTCLGLVNHQCKWPRGKALGGSSSTNFMLAVRGNAKDYDNWERMGNRGWGYKDVLKYFKKLERVREKGIDKKEHGFFGNVFIEKFSNDTIYDTKMVKEYISNYSVEWGLPIVEDLNAHHRSGVTIVPGTIRDMVRWNTAKAYLVPIESKKNLVVMKQTLVTKILIDEKKRAYGVEVFNNGKYKKIFANKEVIVSAGSINSPQLLMLSGIGPRDHLHSVDINVIQDLKIGYNLQDHFITYSVVAKLNMKNLTVSVPPTDILYSYLSKRVDLGLVTDTMIFLDTTSAHPDYPDVQIHHLVFPQNRVGLATFLQLTNFRPEIINEYVKINRESPILVMLLTLLRPESRGRVLLNSKKPFVYPKIITGYLTNETDVKTLYKAFQIVLKLSQTKAFKKYGTLVEIPLKSCSYFAPLSEKRFECQIRHLGSTIYHPVGTCKMGPDSDPDAVVSSTLKVRGIRNLRVADASIIPKTVSGNINLPTIMIGEKASDLIKEDWLLNSNTNEHSEFYYNVNSFEPFL